MPRLSRHAGLLLAACFTCAAHAPLAVAEAAPPGGHRPAAGPERGPDDGSGRGGPRGPHRLLDGVDLSEAQQDRLFAIMHEAAPKRRELEKARHQAMESLGALRRADKFDDAKAQAASQALGQAVAAEELLRARLDAQVAALLTPQQREQQGQDRAPRGPRQ